MKFKKNYLILFLIFSNVMLARAQLFTIAGKNAEGTNALKTSITTPINIVADYQGNDIIIVEKESHRIRKLSGGLLTTIVGTGNYRYSPSVVSAVYAKNIPLYEPHSVATDKNGNIYIADRRNYCVWKVFKNGQMTNLAGRPGIPGLTASGSEANRAFLRYPVGVAVDRLGNVYIADEGNKALYKVTSDNFISTVVSLEGKEGYSGDGGPVGQAKFSSFSSIATDSQGNLYINDQGNHCIRKINPDGIVSTLAGTGVAGYSGDGSNANAAQLNLNLYDQLVSDQNGNIFIVDGGNHRVRKIDANTGNITTIAGTGVAGYSGDGSLATSAQLEAPSGIAIDKNGHVYIADYGNARIRRIDKNTQVISTVAGNGHLNYGSGYDGDGKYAYNASLGAPTDMAEDAQGNLYIADMANHRVRKVDPRGFITTFAGTGVAGYSGDGGKAASAQLSAPTGIAVDKVGNVYIADSSNHCIRKVDLDGNISTFTGTGVAGYSGDGGIASNAQLHAPYDLMIDYNNEVYIADTYNHVIRKISTNGIITTIAGTGVAGYSNDDVQASTSQLNHPTCIIKDWSDNLYIADRNNHRIRKISKTGIITTYAGTGESFQGAPSIPKQTRLYHPTSLAFASDGSFFFSDAGNHLIRRIRNGRVDDYMGRHGRIKGFRDSRVRTRAYLNSPQGIMIDRSGNLYFADQGNNQIRKLLNTRFYGRLKVSYGNRVISGNNNSSSNNSIYLGNTKLGSIKKDTFNIAITRLHGNTPIIFERFEVTGDFQLASDTLQRIEGQNASFILKMDTSTPGLKTGKVKVLGNSSIEFLISGIVGKSDSQQIVYTLAGNNGNFGWHPNNESAYTARLNPPSDMVLDHIGNIYIVERKDHRVRKVDAITGKISNFAGTGIAGFSGDNGKAVDATLNEPGGVAVDKVGNVYIADIRNSRIRRVDVTTGIITTIAGGGERSNTGEGILANEAYIEALYALTIDPQGNIFFVQNYSNRVIKKIEATTGKLFTYAGGGKAYAEGVLATKAGISSVSRIFSDFNGNIYFVAGNRIQKIDAITKIITTIAGTGQAGFNGDNKLATQTTLMNPAGIAVDTNGDIYMADGSGRIRKIDAVSQQVTTIAGNGFSGRAGEGVPALDATPGRLIDVELDAKGKIYFLDFHYKRIRKIGTPLSGLSIVQGNNTYQMTDTIHFDTTYYEQPIQKQFTIKNNQLHKISLSKIEVTDGYSIVGNSVKEIAAGESIQLTIALDAKRIGYTPGRLAIENDQTHKFVISLYGLVKKREQVIDFDLKADSIKTYGDAPFKLLGIASSGLPITYRSADTLIAKVSNDTLFIVKPGRVAITAYQIGDWKAYAPAPSVTQFLTINKASQTITFNLGQDSVKQKNYEPLQLNGSSSAGLKVSYTSSNPKVAVVVDDVVSILSSGTTRLTASQAGNDFYLAADDVSQKLTIENQVTDLPARLLDAQLYFFPNPVNDILRIKFENTRRVNTVLDITLCDAQGKAIKQLQKSLSEVIEISMKDIPSGYYFIKVRSKGEVIIKKIVKN